MEAGNLDPFFIRASYRSSFVILGQRSRLLVNGRRTGNRFLPHSSLSMGQRESPADLRLREAAQWIYIYIYIHRPMDKYIYIYEYYYNSKNFYCATVTIPKASVC